MKFFKLSLFLTTTAVCLAVIVSVILLRSDSLAADTTSSAAATNPTDNNNPPSDPANPDSGAASTRAAPSASNPTPQEQACNGSGGKFVGGSCKEDTGNGQTIKGAVKIIVNTLLFFVGIIAVIVLVISGLRFVAANGEAQQVSKARTNIIYAIIGIVVAFAGYAIVNFILGQI